MTTDRLGFLQFLDLNIASWNEFGLMRCFVLALPLTFSSLRFSVVRLALVLQATKTLAYRSGGDTRLFIRSIVETGSGLLLEGDICVAVRVEVRKPSDSEKERKDKLYIRPFPFSWPYVACYGKSASVVP